MKILITGKGSYIGTSFEKYILKESSSYQIDTIDVHYDNWKQIDFSKYDVVMNVAAIVHKNPKKTNENLYYQVNRDLAVALAKKSKKEGVKQFVQISTMAVYGVEGQIGKPVVIDKNTPCNTQSAYGKSKLEADYMLQELQDEQFIISILRPPIVYGPNCVGNYVLLSKLVKKVRVFPIIENKRSMIYIENLSEILKQIVEEKRQGVFHPQNTEYVSTRQMVQYIAEAQQIKLYQSRLLGLGVNLIGKYIGVCHKVFGNLTYAPSIADTINKPSKEVELKQSIYKIERG